MGAERDPRESYPSDIVVPGWALAAELSARERAKAREALCFCRAHQHFKLGILRRTEAGALLLEPLPKGQRKGQFLGAARFNNELIPTDGWGPNPDDTLTLYCPAGHPVRVKRVRAERALADAVDTGRGRRVLL